MSYQQPHRVGDLVEELDTPALVVCLDKLEENVARMRRSMEKYPKVAVRPHVKTHKCPDIARMQVIPHVACTHPPSPHEPSTTHTPTGAVPVVICCNRTLTFAYSYTDKYI